MALVQLFDASIRRVYRSGWHGEPTEPVFINMTNIVVNEVRSVGGSNPSLVATTRSKKPTETRRKVGETHGENCH